MASDEHSGLKHAFFAERAVSNIPEAHETPREIVSIGVIGGGTMGSGIATAMLLSGLPVTVIETGEDRVEFRPQDDPREPLRGREARQNDRERPRASR